MKPRKTRNPWANVTDRIRQYETWADGYKCGHSDAEMDARENVVNMTDQYTLGLTTEIDQLKRLNSNLVEKNDSQAAMIQAADREVQLLEQQVKRLRLVRDNHLNEIDQLKGCRTNQANTIKRLDGQVNDLRTIKENLRLENLRLEAEREETSHFDEGVDAGHSDGVIEGHKAGYTVGMNDAVAELVVHAQGMGGTIKFLTDHQYKRLKGVLDTVRTHAAELDDEVNGLDGTADMFENVLVDIESPPR